MKEVFVTRIRLAVLACVFLLFSSILAAQELHALAGFETKEFLVDIVAKDDFSFEVVETIRVNFPEERHGIYRHIPYELGRVIVKDVQVDGDPYKVRRTNQNGTSQILLIIGDEDETLVGPKTYRISYTLQGSDLMHEGFDLLHLDLIPPMWETEIDYARARLQLPEPINWEGAEYFSGAYGSEESSQKFNMRAEGALFEMEAYQVLPYEGFTLYHTLPDGYWKNIEDRSGVFFYFLLLLILIPLLILGLWIKYGRDLKIVPQLEFYAPEALTPTEIGMVLDGKVSKTEFLALIPYLANKGHIVIEADGERDSILYLLSPVSELEEKAFVKSFVEALFPNGKTELRTKDSRDKKDTENRNERTRKYQEAEQLLELEYKKGPRAVFRRASRFAKYFSTGLLFLLPLSALLFMGVFLGTFLDPPFFVILLPILWGAIGIMNLVQEYHAKGFGVKLFQFILYSVFLLPGLYGLYRIFDQFYESSYFWYLTLSFFLSLFIASFTLSRSKYSTDLMGKILGFRAFVRVAELDRIKTLVRENPNYFYDVLPYAYIFDLTDLWIKQFEQIGLDTPTWYTGKSDSFSSSLGMASFMTSIDSLQAGISGFESSGGGASGGGSGGGFGGGGGGSW
ncbi:MAG: DUF2207 domain-containing protein [Bacillota bacterium]|nr:DUF2207 domain-containing protein [Bacillota bacterium]